ncbi:hypothetical protein LCGC14_3012390 [marine sediment metagenome]|uniref:Uncharacterized protein n=1 Tax=marine sediment metagenome TaxID=412755 RepID=A0A0F8WY93_9ZZZZ
MYAIIYWETSDCAPRAIVHADGEMQIFGKLKDADAFANEFETNIWDSEVPYFGVPPDVDGDGKITVFIMDIEDGLSGSSYIAGVFLRLHEYDPASFPSDPIIQHSMLMEIVHIDTQAISSGNANGTLAHEFQHLIHFNSDPDETLWIDEAAATFAEFGFVAVPASTHLHIQTFPAGLLRRVGVFDAISV